jgi:hypothetical protein
VPESQKEARETLKGPISVDQILLTIKQRKQVSPCCINYLYLSFVRSSFQSPHMYVIYSIPQLTFIIWGRRDRVRMVVQDPGGSMSYLVGLPNKSCKPITNTTWVQVHSTNSRK